MGVRRPRAVEHTGRGNVASVGGLVVRVVTAVVGVGLVVLERAQARGLGEGVVVAQLERLGELHPCRGVAPSPRWWWSPSASSTGEPRPLVVRSPAGPGRARGERLADRRGAEWHSAERAAMALFRRKMLIAERMPAAHAQPVTITSRTTRTVGTTGISERLPRVQAAIKSASNREQDRAVLQELHEHGMKLIATPTVADVAIWIMAFEGLARTRPELGL